MSCITLLSDFGLQDASVAVSKGIVMQHNPGATIIDISHQTEPFQLQQAAYLVTASYRHFPKGTCHLLLFEIFYGGAPRMVICEKEGAYFIAPDNGILPLALGKDQGRIWKYYELPHPYNFTEWVHAAARACQALQHTHPADMGLEPYILGKVPQYSQLKVTGDHVECQVIYVDRFENVVINITKSEFDEIGKGRPFVISFVRDDEITELGYNYLDVKEGEKLCRFNTAGYLEICIHRGKASSLLGLKLHKDVIYNTIKISFG